MTHEITLSYPLLPLFKEPIEFKFPLPLDDYAIKVIQIQIYFQQREAERRHER